MCTPFDIKTFEPGKNYVIEASAGTGKTYSITKIVEKLLNSDYTLDQLLIVTYTEKAAGELKDRIRSAIQENPDLAGKADKPENNVDTASICTIHAFCQGLLKESFLSAGKPACRGVIDENEVRDFLKRYFRKGDIFKDICDFKAKYPGEEVESKLLNKFTSYLKKYYLRQDGTEDTSIISFDKLYTPEFLQALLSDSDTDFRELNTIKDSLKQLEDSESSNQAKKQNANKFFNDVNSSKELQYSGSYQIRSFDPNDQDAYLFIHSASKIIQDRKKIKNIFSNFLNFLIVKYLPDVYKAWQAEKELRCVQTYNDMIRDVREEVIGGKPLLECLQGRYRYAIIDEFQDTNQKQWDIFRKAFLCEGHNLIVVGDSKQSIYSFQGADVTVYEEAKKTICENGGTLCRLDTNYRSTKDMVEATNAFFGGSTLKDALSFADSNPRDDDMFEVKYKGTTPPALWIADKNLSPDKYAELVCRQIVDFCTLDRDGHTQLQRKDKDGWRNVSFGDFAVLARKRTEMNPITSAFERCGIPYTQYKEAGLFSGKELADWVAVLDAINAADFTGKNRKLFRKAMITDFFGYSTDEANASEFDRDAIPEARLFVAWRALAAEGKWEQLIERILSDTNVAGRLQSLSNLKTFGVLMQIGDYCTEQLSKINSLGGLLQQLRRKAAGPDNDDEGQGTDLVAKATDEPCVQVMTIHASKGLEFPIVISIAGHKPLNAPSTAYSYHKDGAPLLTFDSKKSQPEQEKELQRLIYVAYTRAKYLLMLPRFENRNSNLKFIKKAADAYLNGRDKIWLEPADAPSLEELKAKVQEICRTGDTAVLTEEALQNREAELRNFAGQVYFHSSRKHAYSSLSHGGERALPADTDTPTAADAPAGAEWEAPAAVPEDYIENDVLRRDNGEEPAPIVGLSDYDTGAKQIPCAYDEALLPRDLSPNFPAGTGLGNALHKIFEVIDYQADSPAADYLIQTCFAEERIRCREEWVADVQNMVSAVLHASLPEIHGAAEEPGSFSLSELSRAQRKNEVEFNYNIPGRVQFQHYMNGFVDLIFKRGEYYSVLDWKSDRLNDTFTSYWDSAELKKHVDELYSIQRVLYSYCLIMWLKQFYPEKSEQEIFADHFGGIYYIFLRGCREGTGNGVYAQTWACFDDLKRAYDNLVERRVF